MGRGIGAVVVAELALVAVVQDGFEVPRGELLRIAIDHRIIQAGEHDVKGGTEVIATPAAVADVEDPAKLSLQGPSVPEAIRTKIETHL